MHRIRVLAAIASCVTFGLCAEEGLRMYIGTYTGKQSKGIYVCDFDPATGKLGEVQLAVETPNPTFLALHPNGKYLYSANEIGKFEGRDTGCISAFAIDPATGLLKLLNAQPSMGRGPCHVAVAPNGKHLVGANYGEGSICAIPIGEDGSLDVPTAGIRHSGAPGPNKGRQEKPHAHSTNFDPSGRFVFAADLGLDRIFIYDLDASRGTLAPHTPPAVAAAPGAGPRHLCFHPNSRFAFVVNELNNTVTAYRFDAEKGTLTEVQSIGTLPAGFAAKNTTAEVLVHPSGRFLYASNRGHDSIAIFKLDAETGKLTAAGHQASGGKTPRNFNLTPDGRWLIAANQDSDNVCVFRVDETTGALAPTEHSRSIEKPVRVLFAAHPG